MMKAMMLSAAALVMLSVPGHADSFTLRIGAGHPNTLTYVERFESHFIPEVTRQAKELGHDVRFIKAFAGTVAKLDGISEAVQNGVLDIGLASPLFEQSRLAVLNLLNYVGFGSTDHMLVYEAGTRLLNEYPVMRDSIRTSLNTEVLAFGAGGENYGIGSRERIDGVDDIAGRKIGASFSTATWIESIGGAPVGVTANDMYQALQTNLVEGGLVYPTMMVNFRYYEIVDHYLLTKTGITVGTSVALMNLDTRKKLPPDLLELIDRLAEETMRKVAEASAEREAAALVALEDKVTILELGDEDKRRWAEAMKDLPARLAKELDDKGMPGSEMLAAYIRIIQEEGHEFPVVPTH